MKPSDRDRDLQREIALHLELEIEDRLADGHSPDEARQAAHRALGNVGRIREEARAVWIAVWLQDALQDLRYAARVFVRTPMFTLGAALILALGIGASTAIFGAVNAVLLAPLPYDAPDRLVQLWLANPSRNVDRMSVSLPLYRGWREQARSWTDLAAVKYGSVTIHPAGDPERASAQFVTANTFALLGRRPIHGRGFLPDEDIRNGAKVVVLSERLWQRLFDGNPAAVGQSHVIDGVAHTIVGVMSHSTLADMEPQLWLPLAGNTEDRYGFSELDVIGRLRPGVTYEQAAAEMAAVSDRLAAARLAAAPGEDLAGWSVRLQPLTDVVVGGPLRQRLYLLLVAVGVLLLIACANLSSLQLVRAAARSRELAIRAAIGGGRLRITRQLLTESLLLATVGGLAGLAVAYGLMSLFRTTAMVDVPRAAQIGLDPRVLLFAVGATTVSGVLAGLAPARQLSRLDIQRGLHERTPVGSASARRSRNVLVVGQLALSIVLLAASGLMLRTLHHLNAVDLGFAPARVLTAQVAPRANAETFFATLIERVRGLPGVVGTGATSNAPMSTGNTSLHVFPVGEALIAPTESVQCDWRSISQGYFAAMQTPILAGRDFTPRDDGKAPKVVLVNESLARAMWGDASPLGRHLDLGGGGGEPATVIGLVRDARVHNPADLARPAYYVSAYRGVWGPMTLVVRTTAAADTLLPLVRAEVRALDPSLPVFGIQTMEDAVSRQLAPQRLVAGLLGGFAVLALALAVAGVYGVMAYATSQRTQEVGIRLALGAPRRAVLAALVREGVLLIAVGAALGVLLAVPVTRLMRGLLSAVDPGDPLTFVVTIGVLAVAALTACYLPALRAARVDPVTALSGK
jgi:putative ABC transport system permease protein